MCARTGGCAEGEGKLAGPLFLAVERDGVGQKFFEGGRALIRLDHVVHAVSFGRGEKHLEALNLVERQASHVGGSFE